MTVDDLQDLLINALIRKAGGTKRHWRTALGPIRVYDVATHPHCNWSVAPSGGFRDTAVIERLLDDIRLSHPIVVGR